ncbi:ribosomal protein l1 [Phaffia rhodozyma]|uniref:Ribosomal protein l1 n=1 Tax=Phaffia rhodozyma TaxID=264483 RepID=A0A0F7SL31_PHARH|nr:ribosomal protein l1 [Phaffia rhodozyma]
MALSSLKPALISRSSLPANPPRKKEVVPSKVSTAQATKAVNALFAHAEKERVKKESTQLLSKDEFVWLVIATKKISPEKRVKPIKIQLPTPLLDPRYTSICLFSKDPQREYKDLLETSSIKFIDRVVGMEKLKGKFKPYEARRQLVNEHGMFLCDERIVTFLPKLLGKYWLDAKKQPIPVCMTRKDLKGELERAVSSTYLHLSQGTCTSVKIALLSSSNSSTSPHTPAQALANLIAAIPHIIANIPGGWSNIQSLNIKTSTSISLPLWTCPLGSGEGGRFENMAGVLLSDDEEETEDVEIGSALKPEEVEKMLKEEKQNRKNEGKKRAASEEKISEEVKEKKIKASPAKKTAAPKTEAPVEVKIVAAPVEVVKKSAVSKKAKPTQVEKKVISSASAGVKGKESVVGKKGGKKGGKK